MNRFSSLLVIAALCIAGCASSGTTQAPGDGMPFSFVRSEAPFPVFDSEGVAYRQPFLGGFNVPRPQFVDIDADGDPDLFIQETSGELMFFENDGSSADDRFVWRTDSFEDLDIGEWYRFADLDQDGDFDLLAEERFSHMRVFMNRGTAELPQFELAVDTLRALGGTPIFSDRQNIPNIADIDCDGRLDLFLGQATGTVQRWVAKSERDDGVPLFEMVDDRFQDIEIIGQMQSRHGANTLSFGDYDGDGDLDMFWGDFFEAGVLLIRNRGGCQPAMRGEPVGFPENAPIATSGYNAPAPVDGDADGDMDIAIGVLGGAFNPNSTTIRNLLYLEQESPGTFVVRTERLIRTLDVGSESNPYLFDYDGDGDLDLFVGNKIDPDDQQIGRVFLFDNTGSAREPQLVERGPVQMAESYHQSLASGDLNGDGLTDLVVGKWNRESALFRGIENGLALTTQTFISLTRGSNSTPALVDIDADGDLDLFVGEASGTLNYYRNEGTPEQVSLKMVSDNYEDIDVGRRSKPAFSDVDGDGDYDLFVGTELDGIRFFENTGTASVPRFVDRGALDVKVPALSAPTFADIDGDGDEDMFVGTTSGGVLFFERR